MIELGGFLPRSPGLVEVLGPGSRAGSEVERLAGLAGDLVGVGGRGPLALVAVLHLHVSACGVGRGPDARGVGVPEGHIAVCQQGRCLGSGVHRRSDGGEGSQYRSEQAEAGGTESLGSGKRLTGSGRER